MNTQEPGKDLTFYHNQGAHFTFKNKYHYDISHIPCYKQIKISIPQLSLSVQPRFRI